MSSVTRIGMRTAQDVIERLYKHRDDVENVLVVVHLKGNQRTDIQPMDWDASGKYEDIWYNLGWLNERIRQLCFWADSPD